MLHKETVTEGTLDLINRLMADEQLKGFYLVGGTALSLMIGHRISIDIDLFTDKNFDAPAMAEYLKSQYETEVRSLNKNSAPGFMEGIKFDLIYYVLKQITYGQVMESYLKKYPDVNPEIARASLLYHKDIDFTINITLLKEPINWLGIDKGIRNAIIASDQKLD